MILVTTHLNADFDSYAGVCAALLLHPGAVAAFPGSKEPALRRYLEEEPESAIPERRVRDIDLDAVKTLVLVDTTSAERIGRFAPLLGRPAVRVICYDHHRGVDPPAGAEVHVRPVGAVATLMASLLRRSRRPLDPRTATLLALGIYEDTGGLLHVGTTAEDLEAVAWLLGKGADLPRVARALSRALTADQIDLYHAILHGTRRYGFGGREVFLAAVAAPRFVPDASVVVQEYVRSSGARRFAGLVRMQDRVFVIVRSAAADFDASGVARAFGGGGHPAAAAAVIHGMTLIEAERALVAVLRRILVPAARAADLATPILYTVRADATVEEALALLNRYRVNALPVLRRGRVTGALTRQVADAARHHGMQHRRVEDVVVSEVDVVAPDTDLETLHRRLLRSGGPRFVLVGTDARRVTGIVTRTAILSRLHEEREKAAALRDPEEGDAPGEEDARALLESSAPGPVREVLARVGELAVDQGVAAYLVGGVVRDLLLAREVGDLDVVVEGDALALARTLARAMGGKLRTHETFRTAAVLLEGGLRVDLASARTEHYPRPAALPEIALGGLRQDLFRRDFTINTLAVSLMPESFGRLLDFFGGRRDLRERKIRVLHGLSFIEDPTRAFRAIRFANALGFDLAAETAHLIRVATREEVFERLSPIRLRREVERLLEGRGSAVAVRRLVEHGLLQTIVPVPKLTRRTYARLERAEEVLSWYRLLYRTEDVLEWTVVLGVVAEPLRGPVRRDWLDRIRPGRRARAVLEEFPVRVAQVLAGLSTRAPRNSAIHAACREASPEALLLAMVLAPREDVRRRLALYLSRLRDSRLDIRGADLVRAGVPEGPRVAAGLEAALSAKLDGTAPDREAQMRVALAAAGVP